MDEITLRGISASEGSVRGIFRQLGRPAPGETQKQPGVSASDLTRAIADAVRGLRTLIASARPDEGAILETQVALLEDDALSQPVLEAMAGGADAREAWRRVWDAEIATYLNSDDETFKARAVDFVDARDRVLRALDSSAESRLVVEEGTILVASELTPSSFLDATWAEGSGLALAEGSRASHVAMLARGRGLPMVVGLGPEILSVSGDGVLDGGAGEVLLAPTATRLAVFEKGRQADNVRHDIIASAFGPAASRNGVAVSVQVNIAQLSDLQSLDPAMCDGIGLVRTELFLRDLDSLRDEERQYAAYRAILEWAGGKPVTFRTLDAGGDKPIDGYTIAGEANPFLGMRGIRLSLANEALLRIQLRAIARAAVHGNARIMLPMVSVAAEFDAARLILEDELDLLHKAGIAFARPPLGMMVEVPAAAIAIDTFDADFYSIGSNDLVQYVVAAGRDQGALAHLVDPTGVAMRRLIERVVEHGMLQGRDVSICGEAAGDLMILPRLLDLGLVSVSVPPNRIAPVKARIAETTIGRDRHG